MTKTFKSSIKLFDLATPATVRRQHQRAHEYSQNAHRTPPSSLHFSLKTKINFLITSLRTSSRRKSQRATKTFSAALTLTLIIYDNVRSLMIVRFVIDLENDCELGNQVKGLMFTLPGLPDYPERCPCSDDSDFVVCSITNSSSTFFF